MSWFISIVVLGVLVLVHEWGHFVVARWSGVRVVKFSIGFGPTLWRWRRGETEYVLSLLPLGGYVKMAGEHLEEQQHDPAEFLSKPIGVRGRIVAAGPLVNAIVSIVTLWVVLVVGYPELLPTVGKVLDDMPAKAAGIMIGDRVVAVAGEPIRTWDELAKAIHRAPGRSLALQIDRGGTHQTIAVTPKARQIADPFGRTRTAGIMGIAPSGAFTTYRVSPLEAVRKTFEKEAEWTGQIALSLWSLVAGRISPQESLTGPIGILYLTSEAVRMGFGSLLYLVSIFSLSLAIFNLFPIPILDGGHLFFLAAERLRGRPVSTTVQEKAAQVSFAILMTMLVLVCINDLNRFGLAKKVWEWFRN